MRTIVASAALAIVVVAAPPDAAAPAACDHLPVPRAPAAVANDNRTPAGELRDGVLTLRLVLTTATWRPDGPEGCGIEVFAFAEEGQPPSVPGPLLRVPAGTEVHVTFRSEIPETLWVKGLEERPVDRLTGVQLVPGASHEFRFEAGAPGTYYYFASVNPNTPFNESPRDRRGATAAAFIVDPAGGAVEDRIFVLTRWTPYADADEARRVLENTPDDFFELNTINGLSWPHTERLIVTEGVPVRWRVINPTSRPHLMHLHGFYFDGLSRGTVMRDDVYPAEGRRRLVTEFLHPANTMVLEWTPHEVGNWIFHCHIVRHMTADQRLDRMPGAAGAAESSPSSGATENMAGLIMGVTVQPRAAFVPAEHRMPERRLRLFANQRAGVFGDRPGFGFVLQEGGTEPARDSVRLPGSPLIITRDQLTEIAVQNRLDRPLSVHWHGIELESYYDGVAGWSGIPRTVGGAGRIAPAIAPGDSFVVQMAPPRAGTFIYHIHNEHADELASGLYGPLIVLEPGERYEPEHDRVFVIAEPGPGSRIGAESPPFINGSVTPAPTVLRAGETYRFRFVGISSSDTYAMWLEDGEQRTLSDSPVRVQACGALEETGRLASWRPLARDGANLPPALATSRPACSIDLGPGSTFDYEFSPREPGSFTLYARVTVSATGRLGATTALPIRVEPAMAADDVTRRAAVADTVLALAESWMAAWNELNVDGILAVLGEDLQYYYLGERMDSRAVFERVLREEILPNETWSITTFDPLVQMLGRDAAVVSFRYRGEMSLRGETRPVENATSLVFQRRGGEWKIVHIHDSTRPPSRDES